MWSKRTLQYRGLQDLGVSHLFPLLDRQEPAGRVEVIPALDASLHPADEGVLLRRLHDLKRAGRGDWCLASSWASDQPGVVAWVRRNGDKAIYPKYAPDLASALAWAVEELERV